MFGRIGCYLSGHDYGIKSDGGRMYLRCTVCGHTSDGWSLYRVANDHKSAHRPLGLKHAGARETSRAAAR